MKYFTFTTHDHELTLHEMGEMKRAVMAQIVAEPAVSLWARAAQVWGMFTARAQAFGGPAFVGALTLVLVVGVGGSARYAGYLGGGPTVADTVIGATDTLLSQMYAEDEGVDTRMAKSTEQAEIAMTSTMAVDPAVPQVVTDALAQIDTALTGSSNVNDVPLARIVASLATLQSVAETHVEDGAGTPTDEAVLAFISDKKPLLSLLVSTASNEEKLAIHTAAAEFILEDVRASSDTAGVFAESFLATRSVADDYNETAALLDDLSVVKAVASAGDTKL